MSPKRKVTTDEGDNLPELPPDDDVMRVITLLEYARTRGFKIGPILEVGSVKMHISDLRQAKREQLDDRGMPEPDIYQEHGINPNEVPADGTIG